RMEVRVSRRDTRLRTRAVVGVRLSRAATTLGSGFDADPAEVESADLSRSHDSPTPGVPVVDCHLSRRNSEADLLSGAGGLFSDGLVAGERHQRRAGDAPHSIRAAQHYLVRAAVARDRLDSDLGANQHGEVLDLQTN